MSDSYHKRNEYDRGCSHNIYVLGLLSSCFLAVVSFDGDRSCTLWVERLGGGSRFFPTIIMLWAFLLQDCRGASSRPGHRQQGQNATNGEARDNGRQNPRQWGTNNQINAHNSMFSWWKIWCPQHTQHLYHGSPVVLPSTIFMFCWSPLLIPCACQGLDPEFWPWPIYNFCRGGCIYWFQIPSKVVYCILHMISSIHLH